MRKLLSLVMVVTAFAPAMGNADTSEHEPAFTTASSYSGCGVWISDWAVPGHRYAPGAAPCDADASASVDGSLSAATSVESLFEGTLPAWGSGDGGGIVGFTYAVPPQTKTLRIHVEAWVEALSEASGGYTGQYNRTSWAGVGVQAAPAGCIQDGGRWLVHSQVGLRERHAFEGPIVLDAETNCDSGVVPAGPLEILVRADAYVRIVTGGRAAAHVNAVIERVWVEAVPA